MVLPYQISVWYGGRHIVSGATARHFFSNRVVNRRNLLDQWTVNAPSLNAFKNGLSRIRDNRMGFMD